MSTFLTSSIKKFRSYSLVIQYNETISLLKAKLPIRHHWHSTYNLLRKFGKIVQANRKFKILLTTYHKITNNFYFGFIWEFQIVTKKSSVFY